ncbi:MAG: hypothetical protein FWF46_01475 [Oscillospiraceae bacterium]|nr:hypothetical protein [Oscillospiraceae bacterium]
MSDVKAMGTTLTKVKKGTESSDWLIGSLNKIGEISIEVGEIDVTTLDSPNGAKEFISGDITAGDFALGGYIKKQEDQQTVVKMMALIQSGDTEKWKITYSNGTKEEFDGFVKAFKLTEATTDGLLGFEATLKISGLPAYSVVQ